MAASVVGMLDAVVLDFLANPDEALSVAALPAPVAAALLASATNATGSAATASGTTSSDASSGATSRNVPLHVAALAAEAGILTHDQLVVIVLETLSARCGVPADLLRTSGTVFGRVKQACLWAARARGSPGPAGASGPAPASPPPHSPEALPLAVSVRAVWPGGDAGVMHDDGSL